LKKRTKKLLLQKGAGALAAWFDAIFRRAPKAAPASAASIAISCFHLVTSQGNVVSIENAQLVSTAAGDAVLAFVPQALPNFCFLIASDGSRFAIPGDQMAGPAISARILHTNQSGLVRLKNPLGGMRFLTAPDTSPALRFDGPGATLEAVFALRPVPDTDVSAAAKTLAAAVGTLAGTGWHLAALLDQLRAGVLPVNLGEAALRLLPRDELDDLACLALDDPQTLALLKRVLPNDAFIRTHLPALAAWRHTRRASGIEGQLVSPAGDETLILASTNETGVPLGTALHTLARGHVAPRRGFCLLASARNEGPYLLDWLAYHLSIGFEHVFLYTNDNTDGSDALLTHLARAGIITWVRNTRGEKVGVQEKGYAHALTVLPDILDYRWTAVLDLDEHFCVAPGMFEGVADFMAMHEAQPVDAVALCWLIFSSRLGEPYAEAPTTERFTWRAKDVNTHVKSIFRTRLFWHSQPHYPWPTLEGPFIYRNQDGGFHHHPGVADRIPAFAANPSAEQGWINHYLLRTAPEALWKLARGSAAWIEGEDDTERPVFADFITRTFLDLARPENLVLDTRIAQCAKGQAAMRARLLSLPGVAESHAAIGRDFVKEMKALAERFLSAPLPANATPVQRRFRDALAESLGVARTAPLVTPIRSRMI
jgi:hypothetical protein